MKNNNIFILVYSAILSVTIVVAVLLYCQYQYFKQEAQGLAEVKEAYYQHVEMLKRSLNASMKNEEELSIDQKKKIKTDLDDLSEVFTDEQDTNFLQFALINNEEDKILRSMKPQSLINSGKSIHSHRLKKLSSRKIKKMKAQTHSVPKHHYSPHRDFDFSWPVALNQFWISSLFGPRKRPGGKVGFHHAIDMAAIKGTPVKAAASGTIILAQALPGYGNCIMIQHNDRYKTRYAHLHKISVKQGQEVVLGEHIGSVGATGFVRGSGNDASHLHFEIHQDGHRVNPLAFLFS